ncbi:DUF262 domain-containing protein [Desulfococcaceae bacterium HSG8]|nr:DUF262 domain-containing protein [Desulfococcaceae bacterium HSG8]
MSLFQNEKLSFTHSDKKNTDSMSDEDINMKYVKGDFRIMTALARYPLKTIVTMLDSDDYELQPELRRRHRWYDYKKSHLIESFIMNVPVPPIFLYEDRPSHYEVMDGFQRLTAICEFYKDQLVLEGLEKWPELNGRRYSQLPDRIKKYGIDRRYLSSVILLHETAEDDEEAQQLKQMIFERINSGGVRLTPQESRNAICRGPLNDLCCKLSRNKYLCRTWGIPESESDELFENKHYQRMEDAELVLRFFANRHRRTLMSERQSLKDYLDKFLRHGNGFSEDVLEKLEILFDQTIELIFNTFEEKAFWLMRPWNSGWIWWRGATKTVYEPMMHVFSQHIKDAEQILRNREKFQREIETFYQENYHIFKGNEHISQRNIEERTDLFEEFVTNIIG